MQKLVSSILILCLLLSCGESKKKESKNEDQVVSKQETKSEVLPSADYSTLLVNYECDMDVAEVAKALRISETDMSLAKYQRPGACSFSIKGFGQNGLGDDSAIIWYLEELGKAQVNKEIKSYLDDQTNNEEVLGMGIDLSETGDSYLARQPMHGRVIIMNSNYDKWLLLSYAPKHLYKSRTPAQHDALGTKMVGLANYLLEKHKK
jgi:hypothetical protein